MINWIISFLGNRKQRVVGDRNIKDKVDIKRGVPQGAVLGPFLLGSLSNHDDNGNENPTNLHI